jgi:hypothetical protein
LRSSDTVAQSVHTAIVLAGQYYSTGKFTDQQKADVVQILTAVTNANMQFRQGIVKAGPQAGKVQYVAIATAFVNAMPADPTQLRYYSADSQKLYAEVLGPVKAAVNAISLLIQNSKGA